MTRHPSDVVLDEAAWERFAALFGEDPALREIVALFIHESEKLGAAMVKGAAEGDTEAVRRAAHSLKSTSHHLGALDLSATCRALEQAGKEQDTAIVRSLAPTMTQQLEATHAELRERVRL